MKLFQKTAFLLFIVPVLFTCSCITIVITNEYRSLQPSEKKLIEPLQSFDNTVPGRVYVINGEVLQKEMTNHPKSLVYIFTNGCTGPACYPMASYSHYAESNGYKLYLVMTGYFKLNETLKQQVNEPLFSIDDKYYDTRYTSTYVRYFENDLTGKPKEFKEKGYKGNLYFFNYGKLDTIMKELPGGTTLIRQ